MFRKKFVIIAALLLVFSVLIDGTNGATQYDWKLEKTKNGCQIYTSKSPARSTSPPSASRSLTPRWMRSAWS